MFNDNRHERVISLDSKPCPHIKQLPWRPMGPENCVGYFEIVEEEEVA